MPPLSARKCLVNASCSCLAAPTGLQHPVPVQEYREAHQPHDQPIPTAAEVPEPVVPSQAQPHVLYGTRKSVLGLKELLWAARLVSSLVSLGQEVLKNVLQCLLLQTVGTDTPVS